MFSAEPERSRHVLPSVAGGRSRADERVGLQIHFALDGEITLAPCTTNGCQANVKIKNGVQGTDPHIKPTGAVNATVTVNMMLDGRPVLTCVSTVSMRPNGSFPPDMRVPLADGRHESIGRIPVGVQVLTGDPDTGRSTAQPVTRRIDVRAPEEMVRLTVDVNADGLADGGLVTAANHPMWTLSVWRQASQLGPGDAFLGTGRRPAVTVAVESWVIANQPVHNLAVGDPHTFFVQVGPADILVHNEDCTPFPNQLSPNFGREQALARRLGVQPTVPGTKAFDKIVNSGDTRLKWAVLTNSQLRVVPKLVQHQEISHAILSDGQPVLAAGEAEVAGSSGRYFGIEINFHSGHFAPTAESLQIGRQAFAAFGIEFPP
jgi:hypothetical protein